MNGKWYFSDDLSPSNDKVDLLADSKFGNEKWTSFGREIIQNSIDARKDKTKPVEVVFDLNKSLTIDDIPGLNYTKEVLGKCKDEAANPHTKKAYQKGLELLNRPKVYCMKISDYNTIGVRSGRDEAWGALVFDTGVSIKMRSGAGGCHGVGKKVPFIISSCNTVYYATKNFYEENEEENSDCLFQGKTMLINWKDDNGKKKYPIGWYGAVNNETTDVETKVRPLKDNELSDINPYFKRTDEYGTDVIIACINAYDDSGISEATIKRLIISSVLENFFMAIMEDNLVVDVMGTILNKDTFEGAMNSFYDESKNIPMSLKDTLKVIKQPAEILSVTDKKNNEIGTIELFFEAISEKRKKNYVIVREHGMKITDYRIMTDKPFTAVALVKGEKLNALLSGLENAAHDRFVVDDSEIDVDPEAKSALRKVKELIKEYIVKNTELDDEEDQAIEGLNDILPIMGITPKVDKKDSGRSGMKNHIKVIKRQDGKRPGGGKNPPRPEPPMPKPPRPNPPKPPKTRKNEITDYIFQPFIYKTKDGYVLKFKLDKDIKDAELHINSINSDGKEDASIQDYISYVKEKNKVLKKYKLENGAIKKLDLKKDVMYEFNIVTTRDVTYKLSATLVCKGGEQNE